LGSDTGQPPVTCTGGDHQLVAWLFAVHIRLSRSNALAMVRMSLRMIATIATFADFPAARRARYFASKSALPRMAARVGL
jgi:hypothetical protein